MAERVSEPSGWGRGENMWVCVWSGRCEGEGGVSEILKKRGLMSVERRYVIDRE